MNNKYVKRIILFRIVLYCVIVASLIFIWIINKYKATIFQEGNPLSYMGAIYKLEVCNYTIVELQKNDNLILLAKADDENIIIEICNMKGWKYINQQGSEMIFKKSNTLIKVNVRLYWGGRYVIFEIDNKS